MKKLLTIALLLIATVTTQAQNMSFDETVKYINDKLATASKYHDETITATRNGNVISRGKTYNLFDLSPNPNSSKYIIKQDKGIMFGNQPGYIEVVLSTDGGDIHGRCFYMETEKDAERLYNAFVYLRSLCTKKKDPFDN